MNIARPSLGRPIAFGRTRLGQDEDAAEALTRRERRRKRTAAAGGAAGAAAGVASTVLTSAAVAAVIPAPPFAQIVAAGLVTVGGALSLAAALSSRGSKALAGDESVVRRFAKRAARWSTKRRSKAASGLLKDAEKFTGRKEKRRARGRKRSTVRSEKKLALVKMKLKVLYALEAQARANPKGQMLADDAASVPAQVNAQPQVYDDGDIEESAEESMWTGGGALLGIGVAAVLAVVLGLVLTRGGGQKQAA